MYENVARRGAALKVTDGRDGRKAWDRKLEQVREVGIVKTLLSSISFSRGLVYKFDLLLMVFHIWMWRTQNDKVNCLQIHATSLLLSFLMLRLHLVPLPLQPLQRSYVVCEYFLCQTASIHVLRCITHDLSLQSCPMTRNSTPPLSVLKYRLAPSASR